MAKIMLDGVTREVTVERASDGMTVVVDGRRHTVSDAVALSNAVVTFLLGNVSNVAYISNSAWGMNISLHGRTYLRPVVSVDTDSPAPAAAGVRDGRVQAPMPGSIIALHVREGDHVTAGQPLVVLESMKMHNEITSPANGIVHHVHTKVGDQVSFGHVLAEISVEGAAK
jgi:acetyl/propionyl-CoA carboxylase alpha subunit